MIKTYFGFKMIGFKRGGTASPAEFGHALRTRPSAWRSATLMCPVFLAVACAGAAESMPRGEDGCVFSG